MPELPEVETIVRGLAAKITGKRISIVKVREPFVISDDPERLISHLSGQTIHSVSRHGKKIFWNFNQFSMSIHLRMTGQLLFVPLNTPPEKHAHVIFRFLGLNDELQYHDIRKFGRLKIEGPVSTSPDAWLASPEDIIKALRAKRGMIKHALLNQNLISGLGNIYVDECLFRAKIHPKRRLETIKIEKLKELSSAIKDILGRSIEIGGTSFRNYVDTTGRRGGFKDWLKVYGKAGESCSCGGIIKRTVVASRGTHFCPCCQVSPRCRK